MPPPPYGRGIKWWSTSDDVGLSDVCLLRTLGLSREQRPRKTKIGTELAHVTLGHQFQGQKVKGHRGGGILWRPPAQLVSVSYSATSMRIHRQCNRNTVKLRTTYNAFTTAQYLGSLNLEVFLAILFPIQSTEPNCFQQ